MSDHNRFKQKLGQGLCLLCKVNNKMIRDLMNVLKKDDGNGNPTTPPDITDPDPTDPDPTDPDPTDPVDPVDPVDPTDPVDPPDDTGGDLGTTPNVATFPLMIRTSSFMYPEGASSTQGVELPISLEVKPLMTLPDGYSIDWFLERNGERVADASGLALDGVQVTYPNGRLLLTLKGTDNWMSHDYSFHLSQDAPMCSVVLRTLDPVGLIKEAGSMDNQIAIQFFSNKIYEYEFHCDVIQGTGYAALTVPAELPKHIVKLDNMFSDNALFNDDTLMGWDVSHVKSMKATFKNCPSLAQLFWKWNVKNVENVDYMFSGCTNLNVDFRLWCVPKILTTPIDFTLYTSQHPDYLPVWGTCPSGIEVPPTEESGEYTQTVDPVSGIPLNILRERADPDYDPTNLSVITISKNGGEAKTFTEVHLYDGTIEEALNGGVLFNSVLFINYPFEIGATEDIYNGRNLFCGINEDGSINTPDGSKLNITNDTLLYSFTPPHTVEGGVNTITIYPSDTKGGTLNDAYCTFNGSESGLPLTIQSNAILTFKQD